MPWWTERGIVDVLRLDSRKVCIGHWLTAVLGRASASSLPIAIVITIVSCTLGNDSVPAIRPRLAECVLTAGKHTLKPTRTHERWQASHEIGDLAITIEDGGVTSRGAGSPEVRWTQKSPGGTSLRWAGADEKILYLTKVLEKESKETTHQAPQIHRIRLSDGSWLDPIDLPVDKAEPNTREVVSALLPTRSRLIVLTSKIRKDEKSSNRVKERRCKPATCRCALRGRNPRAEDEFLKDQEWRCSRHWPLPSRGDVA